jgi:lipopolysaccharide biosynthesis protein
MLNIKAYLSELNQRRKKTSAYVTRRRHEEVLAKYNSLKNSMAAYPNPMIEPPQFSWVKPYTPQARELCLFVTYAPTPTIKPYVAWHVQAWVKQGIDVVLIINTDHPEQPLQNPSEEGQLSGLCIRENIGYDFGAWSQMMQAIDTSGLDRVYWVNDSLFGPLSVASFDQMIAAVRSSKADMTGLTENISEERHLQSFFLSFRRTILQDTRFMRYVQHLCQLPTKELVIEFYEIRLTQLVESLGFTTQSLFAMHGQKKKELTYHYPRQLFALGFPYLKTALIRQGQDEGLANECLPHFLPID